MNVFTIFLVFCLCCCETVTCSIFSIRDTLCLGITNKSGERGQKSLPIELKNSLNLVGLAQHHFREDG